MRFWQVITSCQSFKIVPLSVCDQWVPCTFIQNSIDPLRITPQNLFSSPPNQSTWMFTQSLIQEWSGRVFWYAAWRRYANGLLKLFWFATHRICISTEWLGWVAISCEQWRMHTGPIGIQSWLCWKCGFSLASVSRKALVSHHHSFSYRVDDSQKNQLLPWPKKRTIIEIRGEKNAVPRVISCSIRRDQRRASPIRDFCPALIAPDRAWYHTWNSVLLAANLEDGSFFWPG